MVKEARHLETMLAYANGTRKVPVIVEGEAVTIGDPLLTIHAADETSWQLAAGKLEEAIVIGRRTDHLPAVYERLP